jgi:hypothetical protein
LLIAAVSAPGATAPVLGQDALGTGGGVKLHRQRDELEHHHDAKAHREDRDGDLGAK